MRPPLLLGSLPMLLFAGSFLAASPDLRIVVVPQAEVRAGPSFYDDCYPTNTLQRGEQVEVIHDAGNGWLAIKPPAGSFSWIDTSFVKQITPTQPNYMVIVEGAGAPVLVGSWLRRERPTKINAHLLKGTQVRRIGKEARDTQGTLMAIEPPLSEQRYIREEAVARTQTASATPAVLTAASGGAASLDGKPAPAPDADALWRHADQAERAGRLRDAIRLYKLAGDANSSLNPARSREAFDRARYLENALNQTSISPGGFAPAPSYPQSLPAYPTNTRLSPVHRLNGPTSPVSYVTGPSAATAATATTATTGATGTLTSWNPSPTLEPRVSERPTGWTGRLRRSGLTGLGGGVYALETGQAETPVIYLKSQTIDLAGFLGKTIEVDGSFKYLNDIRAHIMQVTQAREVR